MASFRRFVSSRRSSDDEICFPANDSRNYSPLASDRPWANRIIITHHLKLILPELLLARLIKEGKVANMVDEDVSQNGQFGLLRGDFTVIGSKWRAEALEGGGRVEFVYFPLYLLRNKLSLEV